MKALLFLLLINFSFSLHSQIKMWGPEKARAQALYCTISVLDQEMSEENESFEAEKELESLEFITPAAAIPIVSKMLVTGANNLTSRDEKQYSASLNSVNEVRFDEGISAFTATSYFVRKGGEFESIPFYKSSFVPILSNDSSQLEISMNQSVMYLSPVRLERKGKFVQVHSKISVTALIREVNEDGDTSKLKTLKMDDLDFWEFYFGTDLLDIDNVENSQTVQIPSWNEDGEKIILENLFFSYETSFENPIGKTQRPANKLFADQSENITSIIDTIAEGLKNESDR